MTFDKKGDWCLTLEGETPAETAMLAAIRVGYGVNVSTTRNETQVDIKGQGTP
jgi:hypothetical protein